MMTRRHVRDVGGQPARRQVGNRGPRWDEDFAAHVAALFLARELILEMHSGGAGFDHCFDQFEDIQRTAEAGFRISDDGQEPIDAGLAFGVGDLIRALQRLVDPLHHRRHAVRRIKALVRIHLPGEIRVRRDLPSAEINCFQSGPCLLHCLVAGQRTERRNERFGVQQVPKFFRTAAGKGVLRRRRCLASAGRRLTSRCVDSAFQRGLLRQSDFDLFTFSSFSRRPG